MKLRPIQFVYLAILLSSLHMAGASILPASMSGVDGRYLGSVLCRDSAGMWTEITLVDTGHEWGSGRCTLVMIERFSGGGRSLPQVGRDFLGRIDSSAVALPAESLAAYKVAWGVKAPAAHCMSVHTISGLAVETPSRAASL
ncbi:MAG TPA: hypothetical protein VGN01_10835 [Acidobacteriaceae bacterium]|jgi:hypothetical protein